MRGIAVDRLDTVFGGILCFKSCIFSGLEGLLPPLMLTADVYF